MGALIDFEAAYAAARHHTLLPRERTEVLWALAARDVPGDAAELGVRYGGGALLIGLARPGRRVHLFDTFYGHPALDAVDHPDHPPGRFGEGDPLGVTRALFAAYPAVPVTFHIGAFPASATGWAAPLAFAHVDCDLRAGTVAALRVFWPLLVPGGVLLFDDYGDPTTPGIQGAIDEWRALGLPHRFKHQVWLAQAVIEKLEGTR